LSSDARTKRCDLDAMKTTEYFDIVRRRREEAGGRWLRVVVLADGETVHNAFFDRGFEP